MGRCSLQIFFTVQRFFGKKFCQQKLLLEASFYLLAARCMVRILPFRRISALLDRQLKTNVVPREIGIKIAEEIRWAIDRTSRHLPLRLVCFPRGIAAYLMLRRRRVDSQLYYGISNRKESIYAGHVWVKYGNLGIVGCEQLEQYEVLMTFPKKRFCKPDSGTPKHPEKEDTQWK